MTLGDDLSSDQEIDLMAGDALEHLRRCPRTTQGIAGEADDSRGRKQARRLLRQALHPRSAWREAPPLAALGAAGRQRRLIAAVMALQPTGQAVLHQPGGTIGAVKAM